MGRRILRFVEIANLMTKQLMKERALQTSHQPASEFGE
jgi:hypothetical protein